MKRHWPWILGAICSFAFPYSSMLFHHWTPLAYLAMPNWFLYIIICGNIHAGCSGMREFFSVAAAFAGPALLYGGIFIVFQKGFAGISKHTERR